MALLPIHNFFVFNGVIQPNHLFVESENEGGVYEVIRVANGVPLFLEGHLERFYTSAGIAGKPVRFGKTQIEGLLNDLITHNKVAEGNILISCKTNLKAFFISHNYPSPELYKSGVVCATLKAERENPNAKIFQTTVRQKANQLIREKGFYEVLLVDRQGRITEGSRSNIFYVRNNTVATPPGNKVLLGITRQKVIGLLRKAQICFVEEEIFDNNLSKYQAAFITGTSPGVLPVKKIDDVFFNVRHEIVRELINSYNALIKQYISEKLDGRMK
jgi:branched-chain amino acid aminotransferase